VLTCDTTLCRPPTPRPTQAALEAPTFSPPPTLLPPSPFSFYRPPTYHPTVQGRVALFAPTQYPTINFYVPSPTAGDQPSPTAAAFVASYVANPQPVSSHTAAVGGNANVANPQPVVEFPLSSSSTTGNNGQYLASAPPPTFWAIPGNNNNGQLSTNPYFPEDQFYNNNIYNNNYNYNYNNYNNYNNYIKPH